MIELIYGDLLEADADMICQQVNCQGVMGAGLARAIYTKWPVVKARYLKFCRDVGGGDPELLLGGVQVIHAPWIPFDVANIFGQLDYGRKKRRYTSYDAMWNAFCWIRDSYPKDTVIAFPYGIGCGLAGGSWAIVRMLIDTCFKDRLVRIYKKE